MQTFKLSPPVPKLSELWFTLENSNDNIEEISLNSSVRPMELQNIYSDIGYKSNAGEKTDSGQKSDLDRNSKIRAKTEYFKLQAPWNFKILCHETTQFNSDCLAF